MPEPLIDAAQEPASPAPNPWRLIVRTSRSASGSFDTEQGCEFEAVERPTEEDRERWRGIMKTRKRWERDRRALEYERKKAAGDLERMFGSRYRELVFAIMDSAFVEIALSPTEDWTWTAPWEFLLTAVRPAEEASRAPIVVRTFDQEGAPAGKQWTGDCEKLLTVLSTPGPLAEYASADVVALEEQTMSQNFGSKPDPLRNPNLDDVSARIDQAHPWVVHVAGFDVHQAATYLAAGDYRGERLRAGEDGLVLGRDAPEEVEAGALARALCKWRWLPVVLGCNFYYSNRVAACAAAEGFKAAVGFDGVVQDISAQNFFADFYLALRLCTALNLPGSPILEAFRIAFDTQIRRNEGLRTAVVLYSRESLLKPNGLFRGMAASAPLKLLEQFDSYRDKLAAPGEGEVKAPYIRPCAELNYSMLHNNRGIFSYFGLTKTPPLKKLKNVAVSVTLYAGNEQAHYECSGDMRYTYWFLHDDIRVPLTSGLLRSSRSTIVTSIVVRVTYDGKDAYLNTHRVKLLPIDQWQDDDNNRKWLPSFVFPGDGAVRRVIDESQRYLTALADSIGAGFTGYQDAPSDLDAAADDAAIYESVDNQARAMWWALINELPLNYVNPPPSYSVRSQRVRTPSDVLESKRGTCLDLALFFAACLEYVDLRPVVFLLYGHAFPGYFRTEKAHDDLRRSVSTASEDEAPWMFRGPESYGLILDMIGRGDLVPIETLALNQRRGFIEAIEQGGVNLRAPGAFQYLVDIKTAREQGITPLPIWEAR